MEKLNLIAILLVIAVSANSSEIYRYEPSNKNENSHLKCLQFWTNGPLTHCKLIFETQALFHIVLQTKPKSIEDSIEVQVVVESPGKNEKFSITDELRKYQYWSQDFDINEDSRITFKITRDGKLIDLKDVENFIDFVVIQGQGLNSKPIQNQQVSDNLENVQEIEAKSVEDEVAESDEYDTFTDEPTTEDSTDEPTTTTTTSTTSTTENPYGPEIDLEEDLDTDLGSSWTTSCKFYNNIDEFPAEECTVGTAGPTVPDPQSEGFWAPCTSPTCEINYRNPDSEISGVVVNIFMGGDGDIDPPLIPESDPPVTSRTYTKFQSRQEGPKWTTSNLTLQSSASGGVLAIKLSAGTTGDVVIVDKLKLYGRNKALPPPPEEDDDKTLLIVLLSVGSVIVVCVLAGGVYFFIRYKKQNKYEGNDRPLDHYQTLTNYQDEDNYGSSRRDRGGQINESYMRNDEFGNGPRSRPIGQSHSHIPSQGQSHRQSYSQEPNQYIPRFEPTGALPRARLNETASMSTRSNMGGGPSFRRTTQY